MRLILVFVFSSILVLCSAQDREKYILQAPYLFDGEEIHNDKAVVIAEDKIVDIIPSGDISKWDGYEIINYPEHTLMPGMIEGHSHLLLHPYNETSWNDQVLKESLAERAIRAANHAKATLLAGFTTIRDLGAEGARYTDVGVKQSIEKGVIPGPRMIVAGPAIVATGSYGPKGFADHVRIPLGAHEADGHNDLIKEVRTQIGNGADVIKVYADYRWGPYGIAMPTFSLEELELIVKTAQSSGRKVVAHAATAEGMRRATLAGVTSIEHGDAGTPEVFKLMSENGVSLCPTIAAGDAIMQYRGWQKGIDEDPERIKLKKKSVASALKSGVPILAGGDVGVFTHGENVRELELMVEYGMPTLEVLQCVTSGNADLLGYNNQIGRLKKGLNADIIAIKGRPEQDITSLWNVSMVMKDGKLYKK